MSTSGVIEITMAAMGPPGEAYGEVGGDFEGFLPNPTIKAGAVTTSKLAPAAVTNDKIASVSSAKVTGLADSLAAKQDVIPEDTFAEYDDPRLSDERVPTNGSVSTAKIADEAVTDGKIASVGVAKVTGLSALLAGHATDAELAAEVSRATAAENTIDDRVDDEVATRLANDNTLNDYIVAETTRAQTAEGTIAASVETERLARINDVDSVQSDLASETSRAMTAEAAVQASVNAEATRAQAAEGVLDDAIDDEVTDRAAAVAAAQAFAIQRSNHTGTQPIGTVAGLQSELDAKAAQTALDAEVTRATAAESGKLAKTSNLNDLASAETARGNLGLGTAATQNSGAFDSSGAAAAAQAFAIQRGNHTGIQPQNTVQNLVTDLAAKASQAGLDAEVTARTNADALKADLVDGKVPVSQIPSVTISDFLGEIASEAAMVALVGQRGDWAIRTDLFASFILIADDPTQVTSWKRLPTPADLVSSVNGRTGVVTGLAEQTALQSEIDRAVAGESAAVASAIQRANHTGVQAIGTVTGLQGALDSKATANDLTLEIARAVAAEDALETDVQGMQTDLANLDAELVTETANRIADVDAAQAHAIQRSNHTGVQAISTVSGLQGALDAQTTGLTDEATARVAGDALAVKKAANLSDLANFATSRANLGLGDSVITVTGNYVMSSPDGTVLANAAGAAIAVTLPPHSAGRVVRVEKIDASLNQVTITPTAGTVDGAANKVLKAQWEGRTFQSDGTNWLTVARTELSSVADVAADLVLEQTARAAADDSLDAAFDDEVTARTAADLAITATTDDLRADLTDETAARVAGLSGKQPLDSDLTAIAALSTTAFGRDLLALADGTELAGLIPNGTYAEVKNPLAFGAVGDGVTVDSAAFVDTLAAGAEMYLPFGFEFLVGDVEVVGKRVYGGGTIKKLAAAESALHLLGDGATVEGLIFDAESDSGQPSTDIKIGDGATNVLIQNNQFRSSIYSAIAGAVDSLVAGGAAYATRASGVQILANRFTARTGKYARPIFLHSVDNITIAYNIFRGCSNYDAIRLRENSGYGLIHANQFIDIGDPAWLDDQTRDAVDTYWSGDRLTITDNIIRGTALHGLDIKGVSLDLTHQTDRVIITGNQISGCRMSGILVGGGYVGTEYRFVTGVTISDNIVEGCNLNNAAGLGSVGDAAIRIKALVKYCTISTNIVIGNFGRGIYAHNNDAGMAPVTNIDILDNICVNNGHSAGTTNSGIYIAGCSWVNIRGNTCENDSTLPNPYQTHGIHIQNGVDGIGYTPVANSIAIDDNTCRNNTTAQILCDPNNNRATAIRSFSGNVQSAVSRATWQEQRLLSFGAVAPTASEGTFRKGDFLFSVSVASGAAFGRMCVTAGNPGTWLNVYGIGTQQAAIANHADPATATSTDIATKQNALLTVLRHFGFIAT